MFDYGYEYLLRQQEYLLKTIKAMTSRLDLSALLRLILNHAVEMVQGEMGLIVLQGKRGPEVRAFYGIRPEDLSYFAPLVEAVPQRVPGVGSWIIPNLESRVIQVTTGLGLPLHQVVAMPLKFKEDLLGMIYVLRRGGGAFSEDDRQVLVAFADQAAIAVRNARLVSQLRWEKARLDTIIDNSPAGIIILDDEGRTEQVNLAFSHMVGRRKEKMVGLPCADVLHMRETQGIEVCGPFLNGRAQGPFYVEGVLEPARGKEKIVGVTVTPLYEGDELVNVIITVQDITRFKEAEEMKVTFISVISHELKTPVAVIKGYASTLRREDANWDRKTLEDGLMAIEEESNRLAELIDNLLEVSRIQAGALKIRPEPTSLRPIVEKVTEGFRMQTLRHDFVLDVPKNLPPVLADPERLRQILGNLLSNAVKYSPRGGVIRVGAWSDSDKVTVYVADQGIGIPPEEQGRLFRRFSRLDSGLRRETKGTGLGLYLVKSLVEAHGGSVWVHSEPEKGSTFFFTLPVYRPQHAGNINPLAGTHDG